MVTKNDKSLPYGPSVLFMEGPSACCFRWHSFRQDSEAWQGDTSTTGYAHSRERLVKEGRRGEVEQGTSGKNGGSGRKGKWEQWREEEVGGNSLGRRGGVKE